MIYLSTSTGKNRDSTSGSLHLNNNSFILTDEPILPCISKFIQIDSLKLDSQAGRSFGSQPSLENLGRLVKFWMYATPFHVDLLSLYEIGKPSQTAERYFF